MMKRIAIVTSNPSGGVKTIVAKLYHALKVVKIVMFFLRKILCSK